MRLVAHCRGARVLALATALASGCIAARAQTPALVPPAPSASSPVADLVPAGGVVPALPASSAAGGPSTHTPPPTPAAASPAATCEDVTARAMAIDLSAANAQAQRAAVAEQVRLLDQSSALWRQAVGLCAGRARDRAQRNLADSQKSRVALGEMQGAGELCLSSQKDALTLQDLARRVLGERRFAEAAGLFRRAETQWDLAAERCTGTQQQQALRQRELAEIDGHNAEHCGPRFNAAIERTQRFRTASAAMTTAERQTASRIAETLWRDAIPNCKGEPQDVARSQAQTLARERGTPWVETRAEPATAPAASGASILGSSGAPGARRPGGMAAQAGAPAGSADQAPAGGGGAAGPAAAAGGGVVTGSIGQGQAAGQKVLPNVGRREPEVPRHIDIVVGTDTRLVGQFSPDPGGLLITYSGQGRIQWGNGEVYQGAVARGKRHGVGEFIWTSGQRYQGDWVDDRPHGRGTLRFANGNLFEGDIVDGQPQGQGRMIYASGDVYNGQIHQGEPHGQGSYLWISGQRYDGPWVQGKPAGRGAMHFANGNDYEGDIVDGQPQGQGRMRFANGDTYEGQFTAGQPDGQGRFTWKQGDRYSGGWKAGRRDGQGTMQWANGDKWEGLFRNDAQTEQGTLTRAPKPGG